MKHTLVFHLIGLAKQLRIAFGFRSKPFDLSYSEASALLIINLENKVSQIEIAGKLHLKPASIVSLVDELEKLKLVERRAEANDRRKYQIVLTKKGELEAEKIKDQARKLERFLRETLSPDETKVLFRTIEKLANELDSKNIQNSNQMKTNRKEVTSEIPSAKRQVAT